nr:hypothetical protein [Planococcus glaciei]
MAREEAISLNEKAYDLIKERGETEITELTPEQVEEFKKTLEPIYDEFEEEIGADVYEAARAAAGQ